VISETDITAFGIFGKKGLEQFNARLRWSLARCGLDRIDTIIFATGENVNESLPVYIMRSK